MHYDDTPTEARPGNPSPMAPGNLPPNLPTDLLRTLAAVADTGSFTNAARRVHRTQAAVSQQVRRLEELTGCALFTRDRRGVAPTPQGETLLRYARRILRLHDEAMAAVSEPDMAGVVRLGAPEDYASLYLPGILSRFAASHPRVRVDVACRPTTELLAMLDAGHLDLTLATADGPASGSLAGSQGGGPWHDEVVHRQRVVWAASASHEPWLEDPLPLAVFHDGCLYRRWGMDALDAVGRPWRVAFSSPSLAGVLAAVRAGLAVAPLAASVVGPDCRVLDGLAADGRQALPPLPTAAVSLVRGAAGGPVVEGLAGHVRREFRRLGRPEA